jgi:septal ring factor EnvC (AmiA/AmiB activator)
MRVADDAQLRVVRQRYDRLRRDLAELETLRNEVKAKLQRLQGHLAGSDAKSAAALEEDLRVIEASRLQLEREIASSLAELDRAKL